MALVLDHSTPPGPPAAAVKATGAIGLVRYAAVGRGRPGDNVNITQGEVDGIRAAGLGLALVVEHEAGFMLGGRARGATAAAGAGAVARAAGVGPGALFGAVDEDASTWGPPNTPQDFANMQAIASTLQGMADVIGWENTGTYGDYYVIDWVLHHTPCRLFWQCEAWSIDAGAHPAACLYQHAREITVNGVACDVNDTLGPPVPWRIPPAGTTPQPSGDIDVSSLPTLDFTQRAVGKVVSLRNPQVRKVLGLLWAKFPQDQLLVETPDAANKTLDSAEHEVRSFQRLEGLTADGIVGQATWHKLVAW